jgi:hypothetical protein
MPASWTSPSTVFAESAATSIRSSPRTCSTARRRHFLAGCRARRRSSARTRISLCEPAGRGLLGSLSKRSPGPQAKVPLRKGAARTGLQIALELDSPLLVRELDGDVENPRAVARGVGATAGVVVSEAGADVVCEADIWTARIAHTAQDVDDAPRWHAAGPASAAPRGREGKRPE